jgi:hypothetical protein
MMSRGNGGIVIRMVMEDIAHRDRSYSQSFEVVSGVRRRLGLSKVDSNICDARAAVNGLPHVQDSSSSPF